MVGESTYGDEVHAGDGVVVQGFAHDAAGSFRFYTVIHHFHTFANLVRGKVVEHNALNTTVF